VRRRWPGGRAGGLLKALTPLDLESVPAAITGLVTPMLGPVTGPLGGGVSQLPVLPVAGGPASAPRSGERTAVRLSGRRNTATCAASAAT